MEDKICFNTHRQKICITTRQLDDDENVQFLPFKLSKKYLDVLSSDIKDPSRSVKNKIVDVITTPGTLAATGIADVLTGPVQKLYENNI